MRRLSPLKGPQLADPPLIIALGLWYMVSRRHDRCRLLRDEAREGRRVFP